MQSGTAFRILLTLAACLAGSDVRGESLFQRQPEPGEWCRYDTVLLSMVEGSANSMPEQHGAVTVTALDVVEHDGVPHQWIEVTNSIDVPTGNAGETTAVETMTYKCLIQRDQLRAGGDPISHIARGWLKGADSTVRESNVNSFSREGPESLILRFVMIEPLSDVESVSVPNSARIGDEVFETSEGITGKLETLEFAEGMECDGEFSFWTHEEAGFGVPASEFLLNVTFEASSDLTLKSQLAAQLEIVEQGDGAVSKLPDHN